MQSAIAPRVRGEERWYQGREERLDDPGGLGNWLGRSACAIHLRLLCPEFQNICYTDDMALVASTVLLLALLFMAAPFDVKNRRI
jgi:hypothetical protein